MQPHSYHRRMVNAIRESWKWEGLMPGLYARHATLFQLCSDGHIFQEASQHRLAIFANRCRDNHAV